MIQIRVGFLFTVIFRLSVAFRLNKLSVHVVDTPQYQTNDKNRFLIISKKLQLFNLEDDNINFFDNSDEIVNSNAEKIGLTYSKKKLKRINDKRDLLPFDIYLEKDSDVKIGSFMLDSSTACGDIVDLGIKGIYNVKKVTFLYRYESSGFRVFRKKLHLSNMKGSSSSDLKDMISFANTSPFKVQNDTTYFQ